VTRCQGVSLHSPGCVVSVPLACRSLGASSKRAREDLSDQGLPIIGAVLGASEALPCVGNALSSIKLNSADRGSPIGGANVRFWTKADKPKFWPAMVCPLLTHSGHQGGQDAACQKPGDA
jgi:hypothetical protein